MNLSDFNTLADAQAYQSTNPRLIHRDTMNSLLASAGLYVGFQAMAKDDTNPFQNLIAAFLDSTEYNFIIGDSTGDRQIAALDSMIGNGSTELGQALAALKPVILGIANPVTKPFENETLHKFQIAKGVVAKKAAPALDGNNLVINVTTQPAEAYSPRVTFTSPRTNKEVVIATFEEVFTPGKYEVYINPRWVNEALFIDDTYGVL